MKPILRPILVALLFVLATVFIAGFFNVYNYIPHLDKIFHFFGGGIAAWFVIEFWKYRKHHFRPQIHWTMIFSAVLAIGLLWELAEYLSSLYSPHYFPWFVKYFYGGGLYDSIGDVVADMTGALLIIFSYPERKQDR